MIISEAHVRNINRDDRLISPLQRSIATKSAPRASRRRR